MFQHQNRRCLCKEVLLNSRWLHRVDTEVLKHIPFPHSQDTQDLTTQVHIYLKLLQDMRLELVSLF